MNEIIGALIPLGVGAALSPLPIVAVILMLFSSRPKSNSLSFVIATVLGSAAVMVLLTFLAILLPVDPTATSHPITGTIKIVLGVLMLVLGILQWRGRPKDGAEPELPGWMQKIDGMSAGGAAIAGLALIVVNLKNLPIFAAAATHISYAETVPDMVVAGTVFVILASILLIGVVVAALLFPDQVMKPLGQLRTTLVTYNNVILAAVFVLTGATILGHGIQAL